ncbi:FAD-dependent oxidoreductase [Nocardia arthritidis]|uniref:FAD-dependent oxidoreductase n=1 Tax=Nocardia arthritidis TaxID=228602 RepID=A0A6G9Y634_9NOCA|nr:FAD-dependent oxidoreductase [Nocardia arthritidis]QIS08705.1 FAD-dependent oxidoreductase [Nocardia arthritidis]
MTNTARRHVVIIGGGPAGTAAAESALSAGAFVTLIDSNETLGGQYNRRIPAAYGVRRPLSIGHGYRAADRRAQLLTDHPRCEYLSWATVFRIEPTTGCPAVRVLLGIEGEQRTHRLIQGDALVLATGAYDRVCPFPGWDLPGVYSAGAAQTLAKTQRVLVGRNVLISGTGPFLLPVAKSLVTGGARVRVLEANQGRNILRHWAARPWELRHSAGKATELAEYLASGVRHRIPLRTGHAVVAVAGDGRVEEATVARLDPNWMPIPGSHTTIAVDAVAVSHGFTPQHELAVAAGARLTADGFVEVDHRQRTSNESVWAAGELTGIGGAQVAAVEGAVAGLAAAGADLAARRALAARHRTARQFVARLAAAHPIRPGVLTWARPETVICRCEGTTRGELTAAWARSTGNAYRPTKLATRAGLGPCQGRICAANIAALHRDCHDAEYADGTAVTGLAAATPALRPFAAPIRLRELAELDTEGQP